MRILHIITDTNFGGAGRYLLNLVTQPLFEGHCIITACPDGELGEKLDSLGIKRIGISAKDVSFSLRLVPTLCRIIRREKIDVVHTHASLSGRIAAKITLTPSLYTKHGLGDAVGSFLKFAAKCVERTLSDKVIAVSCAVKDSLLALGTPPKKIVIIPGGIDLKDFFAPKKKAQKGCVVLGAASRLSQEKGLDVFIEAASMVSGVFENTRFLIAGAGPLEGYLKKKIRDLNLDQKVRLLGHVDDMPEFLRSLDVFCLPSRSEGFGLSMVEAMATGLPVVASRVGGVPEVLIDGKTGFAVPPDSPRQLARALLRLVGDGDLRRQMGEEGSLRARRKFGAEAMARETLKVYYEIAKRGGPRLK